MRECRHCKHLRLWTCRGLCWTCIHTPEISQAYPSESKFSQDSGVGKFYGLGKPTTPTNALPGTPEKVAVLEARAAAGEQMWHPEDGRCGTSALILV